MVSLGIVLLAAFVMSLVQSYDSTECGIYLAPSTIPGAGLGMFAGKNYNKSDAVAVGDIVLPLVELWFHNGYEEFFFLWEEYQFSHDIAPDMARETGGHGLYAASIGIGAGMNCLLSLVNVVGPQVTCDNAGLHRSKDPGSGAFTPYHGGDTKATKEILKGEELFINYGDQYFRFREETYGLIPLTNDFPKADEILKKYQKLRDSTLSKATYKLQNDLWALITNIPMVSRVINALPPSIDRVDELAEIGTNQQHKERSRRTLDWLNNHGHCMDNIKPGLSNIPQAGRGAFASRKITKGTVVSPTPLIHIPDRTRLIMYDKMPMNEYGYQARNVSAPNRAQLLVNYCFGHSQSSLLLSPYGSLTPLINHSPTPNTRIQWSKTLMQHAEWLEQDHMSLDGIAHTGLSIDYVALRDIDKDEEITLNYGHKWQTAWDEHIRTWYPPKGADRYDAAYELNHQVDLEIRTMYEPSYSETLELWVHGAYISRQQHQGYEPLLYRVVVVGRYNYMSEILYTILPMSTTTTMEDQQRTLLNWHPVQFGVPRDAFVFCDVPFTRDHQMTWAFRHEIQIPDDMMPEMWKNLK